MRQVVYVDDQENTALIPRIADRYSKPEGLNEFNKQPRQKAGDATSRLPCCPTNRIPRALTSLLLLLVLLTLPAWAAESFSGECIAVNDGDTITVLRGRQQVKIRLEGIDCPELGQDFGTRAKQFMSSLVFGKTVTVAVKYLDKNDRSVSRVRVEGRDASQAIVEAGLAWHYRRFSSDQKLSRAEEQARRAKKGLWSHPRPIPPWVWRENKRERTDR